MEQTHEQVMLLALELAARGLGEVEPNPAVGCVIVKDGRILGQGWHRRFGGPHAEVEAINDCRVNGSDPRGATLYVTLEPCCHHGKTPPCSQAVIAAGIKTVYVAAQDPTAKVASKGIAELRAAGIDVHVGLCRDAAESLNAPFFKYARTDLPWVIVKWAQSIDGKLAWKNPPTPGAWLSGEQSRRDVHRLRKKVQAILTGISTVLSDNPRLTVRLDDGRPIDRPPLRVALDSHLRLPWDCRLITVPEAPTLIVTTRHTAQAEAERVEKFTAAGVEVLAVGETDHRCDLPQTLAELGQRGIQQVLVEAGPTLLTEFLKQGLADELRTYVAPLLLGGGGQADIAHALSVLPAPLRLTHIRQTTFDTDACFCARIEKS